MKGSSVTLRAFEALEDDNLIREKFATPSDVLEHLTHGEEFKSLSDNIKEVMTESGLCSVGSDDNEFIAVLYERLNALELSISQIAPYGSDIYNRLDKLDKNVKNLFTKKKPTSKETVKRWIVGNTQRTSDYNSLVKICFALELDLPLATALLNKSGFNSFNIRNPLDAIFIYCILNKRPLSSALDIYLKYLDAPEPGDEDQTPQDAQDGSSTTQRLENSILRDSSWDDDESFLTTFLIPNKGMFTQYSKTAFAEYEKIKNPFFLTAIKMCLDEEAEPLGRKMTDDFKRKLYKRNYGEQLSPEVDKTDVKISYRFKTNISHHAAENEFMKGLNDRLDLGIESDITHHIHLKNNLSALCDEIGTFIASNREDPEVQFYMSRFISDVMSVDYCLFKMLPSVIGADTRKRAFKESELSDTVLYLFPHRENMAKYEKQPASAGNGVYIRKAIIIMYYFAFAYEFSVRNARTTYFADTFSEYDFSTFIEEVNAALARCRFAPLYPANRFDWLILCSIRQFEIYDFHEDPSDCISFFNDVLEISFA